MVILPPTPPPPTLIIRGNLDLMNRTPHKRSTNVSTPICCVFFKRKDLTSFYVIGKGHTRSLIGSATSAGKGKYNTEQISY